MVGTQFKTVHVVGVGNVGLREVARSRAHLSRQMETAYGHGNFQVDDSACINGLLPPGVVVVYVLPGLSDRVEFALKLFDDHKVATALGQRLAIRQAFAEKSTTFGATLLSISVVVYDKAVRFGADGVANVVVHEAGHALSNLAEGKDHAFGGVMAATPSNLGTLQDWPPAFVESLRAGK